MAVAAIRAESKMALPLFVSAVSSSSSSSSAELDENNLMFVMSASVVDEVLETKKLSQATYDMALAIFG